MNIRYVFYMYAICDNEHCSTYIYNQLCRCVSTDKKAPPTLQQNQPNQLQLPWNYYAIPILKRWKNNKKQYTLSSQSRVCAIYRTKVKKAKATHTQREGKQKMEGERQRERTLTMCGKFGQLVYFVCTFRKKNTHAHMRYSLECMSTVILTIHKTHITLTHISTHIPTHQPPINTHTYTQVFFVVDQVFYICVQCSHTHTHKCTELTFTNKKMYEFVFFACCLSYRYSSSTFHCRFVNV